MLLRSITLNENDVPVEQFTFTQLEVGDVLPQAVEPQHATRSWRIEEATVRLQRYDGTRWVVVPFTQDLTKHWVTTADLSPIASEGYLGMFAIDAPPQGTVISVK